MHIRFVLPLLAAVIASGQTITTIAGNGTAGFAGDTGQATQAQINRAVGLVTDANGNLYLAEELNNRVRKVDTSGVITTFAGTGTAGFSGDSGPAAQAQLSGPLGLCIDPSGNIYVNDQGNKRVRKISPQGIITTVAGSGSAISGGDGGPATAAGFVIPIRCAVDKSGSLLIVDQGAHKIRRVDSTTNTISTFAGTGSQGFSGDGGQAAQASFNNPTAAAVDAAGNLYVTDQSNQRIRRIDTGGIITTVAGNGSIAFSGDGGPAASAALNYPGGIVLDSSGTLYIVDSVNQRVRKVSGTTISTIAGTGTAGFSGDGGAALQAQLNSPFAITADSSGNLYVGDTSNNRIRKIAGASTKPGPTITSAGVTNAASFQTGIAPGGIITIFGSNLGAGAGQIVTAPGAPWPPQVGGVSVTMDGVTAPVYRVLNLNGQEQLSVQAPWSISGKNSVVVSVTTGAGNAQVTVPVLGAQPGIFILDAASSGATHSDGSIAGALNPAARGETLVLYLTGLGPVQNTPASGDPASSTTLSPTVIKPTVTIGGFDSTVIFSGLAPGFIGLYQINVTVPAAVATGTVDLTVLSNGVTSNTAKIPVK